LSPEDAAYLGGLIDGEGTISLTRRWAPAIGSLDQQHRVLHSRLGSGNRRHRQDHPKTRRFEPTRAWT